MKRFLRTGQRGVVAIELAALLPILLLILFGFTEIYLYYRAVSICERTAFTLADAIGQKTVLIDSNDGSDSRNIGVYWIAASEAAAPLALAASGAVVVSSIGDPQATGAPEIVWQRAAPWPTPATSQLGTQILPSGYPFHVGDAVLAVEVFYTFKPFALLSTVWPGAPGQVTLYERAFVRPRYTPATAASAPIALEPAS